MNERMSPDVGRCLREGWELYKREPLLLSGATIVVALINALASTIPFAAAILYAPLLAGLYILIMRVDEGKSIRLVQVFDGFKKFLPLALASIVMSLLITLGLILLVIPGVYLAIAYGFTTLNIIDKHQDFWPAMENSRKTITSCFWSYSLLVLLMLAICIAGSLPFGLGLPIAVPVCIAAQYFFYRALGTARHAEVIA